MILINIYKDIGGPTRQEQNSRSSSEAVNPRYIAVFGGVVASVVSVAVVAAAAVVAFLMIGVEMDVDVDADRICLQFGLRMNSCL